MGTRADFYVQYMSSVENPTELPGLRWLGSVAMDGSPDGFDEDLFGIQQDSLFQPADEIWAEKVTKMIAARKDGILPEHGWPWPWDTSATTDFAYVLKGHQVWGSCFGRELWQVLPELDSCGEPWDEEVREMSGEPDPDAHKKVTGGIPDWPDMRPLQGPLSHHGMITVSAKVFKGD